MADQDIIYSKEDSMAIVTLNRPQKLNAITHPILQEMHSIIEEIWKDNGIRSASSK